MTYNSVLFIICYNILCDILLKILTFNYTPRLNLGMERLLNPLFSPKKPKANEGGNSGAAPRCADYTAIPGQARLNTFLPSSSPIS